MGLLFPYIQKVKTFCAWRHNDVIIAEFVQITNFSEILAKIEFHAKKF